MYITFGDYTKLGYTAVPEDSFARFEMMASSKVRKHTFGRITFEELHREDLSEEDRIVAEMNMRGICEITELLYNLNNPAVGETGAPIKSFSNEGYSETLTDKNDKSFLDSANSKINGIMSSYFLYDQLYRGNV